MVIRAKLSAKGLLCCPCKAGSHTPQARHHAKGPGGGQQPYRDLTEVLQQPSQTGSVAFRI